MRTRFLAVLAIAALALTAAVAAVGTASAATVRQFEGRVLSVDRDAKSFRLRDSERGTVTIFVVRSTRFEGTSFTALSTGRTVEARVTRVDGRWQASKIERNAGSHAGEAGDDRGGSEGRHPAGTARRRVPARSSEAVVLAAGGNGAHDLLQELGPPGLERQPRDRVVGQLRDHFTAPSG